MDQKKLLSSTAFWTASVRARENEHQDRLFNDPWAAALAGEDGKRWIEGRPENSTLPIALRTRYFDDFLQRIANQEGIRQIVLLAAGLDTRAYRLDWPAGTQFFELDQPEVLEHKEQIMQTAAAQPSCQRFAIGADLTGDWKAALIEAGFKPQAPTGWLMEGFLFYLPNESITHIINAVTGLSAPQSWLGCDIVNAEILTSPLTKAWIDMQAQAGAPWIGTMDDPTNFFGQRGWQASLSQAGAGDANHGRWPYPVIPTTMPGMPHNWYVTAKKEA